MDISQFREDFPEFADTAVYPDAQATLWLNASANFVDPCRWGDMADLGRELWTAHNLAIWQRNKTAAAIGGAVGGATGNVSAKRVADGSIAYDNTSTVQGGPGQYNLTTYGKQYLEYAEMFGAGCLQLS